MHDGRASKCRAIEHDSKAEIQQNQRQKHALEQKTSQLSMALEELQEASDRCSSSQKEVSHFRDQAKVLLDQYGIIIYRLQQVVQSSDVIKSDTVFNPLNWDTVRYIALQSVLDMMTTLYTEGLLEGYNHTLLDRLEAIEMPSTRRSLEEVAW